MNQPVVNDELLTGCDGFGDIRTATFPAPFDETARDGQLPHPPQQRNTHFAHAVLTSSSVTRAPFGEAIEQPTGDLIVTFPMKHLCDVAPVFAT
jgi:hypothetical protein